MKILFAAHGNPSRTPGGIETYARCIAPALVDLGHEVHLLWLGFGQGVHDGREGGVTVHLRPWRGPRALGRAVGLPHSWARIRVALAAKAALTQIGRRFDVIEAPEWMAPALLSARSETPLLLHLHTPICLQGPFTGAAGVDLKISDRMERSVARRAALQTAPSELLKRELQKLRWPGADAIEIVRQPVDLTEWQDAGPVSTTDPVVLVVGRLERRKAPEVAVEAGALLARTVPGLKIVFIGTGNGRRDGLDYADWLRKRADALGSPSVFVGEQRGATLREWMRQARVVAVPSAFDNFPIAALEGMAAGRPLVCTQTSGCAEIMPSRDSLVVGDSSPQAFAAAIEPLLSEPSRAERLGAECRHAVEKEAAPDTIAAQREALMLRLL